MPQNIRSWRSFLKSQYRQELEQLKHLPLSPTNAPLLIGTGAGNKGNFEIAWNLGKTVLMVWATSGTWDNILNKIVLCNSPTNHQYVVDKSQKNLLLSQTTIRGTKPFRSYSSSLLGKMLRRLKPWRDEPITKNFGSWVELSYLLPSYITWRFASQFQDAGSRGVKQLRYIQQYAIEAKHGLCDHPQIRITG